MPIKHVVGQRCTRMSLLAQLARNPKPAGNMCVQYSRECELLGIESTAFSVHAYNVLCMYAVHHLALTQPTVFD